MNATKAMPQSRYGIYQAQMARRLSAKLIPHSIAVAAAFSFICALVIGAI